MGIMLSCKTHTTLFMVECWQLNRLPPPGPPGVEGVWTWTPSRIKYKTCQRAEELLVSQRPSISGANCVCGCPPAVCYLPLEVGGRQGVVLRCCPPDESPQVNLMQSLPVGAWNVRSLRGGEGPGICLGNGQTEAPGVAEESGRSEALWRMLPMND